MHLMRSFLPGVDEEEGAAALLRVLAGRNCRLEPVIVHTTGELAKLQSALVPGSRLFTRFALTAPGVPVACVLDEATDGFDGWDPALTRELSANLGGFAVSAESSSSLSRHGYAVFFAGRTIEYLFDDPVAGEFVAGTLPSAEFNVPRIDDVDQAFADLYERLTGGPASGLIWNRQTRLSSIVAGAYPCEKAWQPRGQDEPPLALAVFALVEGGEFAAAWNALGAGRRAGWHWRAEATTLSKIGYVVLTRDSELDLALCETLARALDVPAAAVALHAPGAAFDWWNAQPGETPRLGRARGAEEFVQRLMPATVSFGERPGVVRIRPW